MLCNSYGSVRELKVKNIFKVILIILLGACLAGIIKNSQNTPNEQNSYEYCEEYVRTQELPILLEVCYFSEKEWEDKLKEQNFGEIVTWEIVDWLAKQTGIHQYITYEAKEEKDYPSREEWNQIYEQFLDLLDDEGKVKIINEVILEKKDNRIVGGNGEYTSRVESDLLLPMYASQFYVYKENIIGIKSLRSEEAQLSNVYIFEANQNEIQFLFGGNEYQLSLALEQPIQVKNRVCDLLWKKGVIAKVQMKEDTIQGDLIAVNESTIEIEGEILRSINLPVYKTYGTVEEKELTDIVMANMNVEYVVANNSVEAILLKEPAQISRIRVLLLNEENGPYRQEVYIGANTSYQITNKKQSTEHTAEAIVKASDLFSAGKVKKLQITPKDENGELFLCDENGNRISKGYRGSLELRKKGQGFTVVNEVSIEEYLCAVVPSEMPASYELEALKAQAICARSYAYIQLERGDYAALGAHVDDSTNYQVYNKQDRNEKTTAAVLDTAGMVITYEGKTAEAYYFSTSAGVTGNGEAWNLTIDPKYGYLCNRRIKENGEIPDLSSDDAFAQYIETADAKDYEAALPYYRWKATGDYTSKETRKKIKSILSARKAKTPQDILFFDKNNQQIDKMKKFGKLVRLSVTKRSVSGVALQLVLEYENGNVKVGNEYSIRALLGAGITSLTLADGSKKECTLLPSAYMMLTPLEDGTYSIAGGGYGHGIGMSQNGAKAMAACGKSCEEILKFFYQNIEITNLQ